MKKVISILMTTCLILCLCGCATTKGTKNYNKTTNDRIVHIVGQSDLYYDINTKVVYIIFNEYVGRSGYGYMSPYYADNGLPYVYNTESGALEKIDKVG